MKVVVVALSKAYRAQHGGSVWRKGVQHGVTGVQHGHTATQHGRKGFSTAYRAQHGVQCRGSARRKGSQYGGQGLPWRTGFSMAYRDQHGIRGFNTSV